MARLTIEAVQHAINELQAQGKKPTNQNVISFLGHGSFSTLTKLRKLYPDVFGTNNPKLNTVQNTVQNTVDDLFVNTVWQRLEPHVDKHVQSVLKKYSTVDNTDLQVKLDKALDELKRVKADNAKLLTNIERIGIEKDELVIENKELIESFSKFKTALSKLVFFLTTGTFGDMVASKDLVELTGLTNSEIGNLKQVGKKIIARDKR